MIEVQHLTKKYGTHYAVKDVSFTVGKGEILGFLGPNGAGKSTTMNILTGYLSATEGTALIDGHDILDDPNAAKALIGFLPEQPPLYPDMTVREYLDFMCDLKKCKLPRAKHIAEICKVLKIEDVYGRLIKNLSKGYKQRVGFAQALIGNPPILILDEPTVGLDPNQIIEIRSLIRRLGENHTVILSSHILPEIEAVADRIVVINKGQIVADDTPDNLVAMYAGDRDLVTRIAGDGEEIAGMLGRMEGVDSVTARGEVEQGVFEFSVKVQAGCDIRAVLFDNVASHGWKLLGLQAGGMTLEDAFITLTRGAGKRGY